MRHFTTTDFDRLLASQPVNRQSAVVTAGGEPELTLEAPPAAPARTIAPADPMSADTRRRLILRQEIKRLDRGIAAASTKGEKRELGRRKHELADELAGAVHFDPALKAHIVAVAQEQLPAETWRPILAEARRRLVVRA